MRELVNVRAIGAVIKLAATREINVGSGRLFTQLFWLNRQAVNVRNGVGHITVVVREAPGPRGLKGRRHSGVTAHRRPGDNGGGR